MWELYRALLIYLLKSKDDGCGIITIDDDELRKTLDPLMEKTGRNKSIFYLIKLLDEMYYLKIWPEVSRNHKCVLTESGVEMAELLENEERWNECLEYLKEKNIPLVKESIEDCYSLFLKTMR